MDMKWEIPGKGRNSPNYGYYMLLIIAAPDVRDHLSDREVSTVLFLPTSIGSMVGELPRALYISGQWIFTNIQECSKSSLMLISAKRFSWAPTRAIYQHGASPCRSMPQLHSRRQLRRREAGWEAAGSKLSVRRITNSIRRDVLASPQL